MKLAAENVSVARGGRPILTDVSLQLNQSGGVAIVGSNGAGKTTLLLTLLGLLRPVRGRVSLDERDIVHVRRREVARQIAYVPQSVDGFEGFAVEQVVAAGRYPHRHPLEPLTADDRRIVDESLALCAITQFADRAFETLSGGERQRVWLAAALAQQSPILLLDEPAAALDPRHQVELVRLLRQLASGDRLVVMVAHDLNLAAAVADRIIALRGGRIAYDGATQEFLTTAQLHDIFDTQFAISDSPAGVRCVNADFSEARR